MNRKDIISLPNPSLRQRSRKISAFDSKLADLCRNMEEATLDWEEHRQHEVGVALAAPQINVLKRLVVIRNDFDNKDDKTFLPLVNPKVIRTEGRKIVDYEGCLSVPDIYGQVPRFEKVKIKAQDLDGKEFRLTAEGFLARIIQHEVDHTNGVMFIDYIKDEPEAFHRLDEDGKLVSLEKSEFDEKTSILWD